MLLFWKEKQHVFNYQKWRKLILVTSALVERFFSKTGFILRPHRSCMQADLAENSFYAKENINFLNSNIAVFEWLITHRSIEVKNLF